MVLFFRGKAQFAPAGRGRGVERHGLCGLGGRVVPGVGLERQVVYVDERGDGGTIICPDEEYQGATKKVWIVGSQSEINIKDLKGDKLQRFREADKNEWESIVKSGSVRILYPHESENCRRMYGAASILAQRLHFATIGDLISANKMAKHLRATASQGVSFWTFQPDELSLVSISDSGGIGSDSGAMHNAQKVLAVPRGDAKEGADLQATPLSWRSGKYRRVVNSTLAGETQAASPATAEAEWIQVLL